MSGHGCPRYAGSTTSTHKYATHELYYLPYDVTILNLL